MAPGDEAEVPGDGRPCVRCDVRGLAADITVVDALARLALAVQRQGGELRLWRASAELLALIRLAGLEDVLRELR